MATLHATQFSTDNVEEGKETRNQKKKCRSRILATVMDFLNYNGVTATCSRRGSQSLDSREHPAPEFPREARVEGNGPVRSADLAPWANKWPRGVEKPFFAGWQARRAASGEGKARPATASGRRRRRKLPQSVHGERQRLVGLGGKGTEIKRVRDLGCLLNGVRKKKHSEGVAGCDAAAPSRTRSASQREARAHKRAGYA